jgi:D-psicose/D-tagatose/L-ribulose 3-epimerase
MKFGIHSLLFSETFTDHDLLLLDKAKAMGFEAVDIVPFEVDKFPAGRVRQRAEELGLEIIIEIGMPAHANIISPDQGIRAAGVELSKRLVDVSAEAGATVFGGVNYAGWGYLTGRMRTDEEWKWGVENFRQVADYAAAQAPDLTIALEVVNRFESHFLNIAADAVRFIHDLGTPPNVKVHLDAVKYQGVVTIESFDPNFKNIAKLCCIWRKLADSPEQLATEGLEFLKSIQV